MKQALVVTLCVLAGIVGAADPAAPAPQPVVNPQFGIHNPESVDAVTIPRMLSYQGKLTDTLGNPVPNNTYSVAFRLYTQASGGSAFWNETQGVTTKSGLFSVLLGAVTPIGYVPDAGNLYLGMAVGGGAELAPRTRIVSAAYAYKADTANYALAVAGGGGDNAWVRVGADSVLYTIRRLGVARGGSNNKLWGTAAYSHVNFGVSCTTGASGQNRTYAAVAGGLGNRASGNSSFVGGGSNNAAGGENAAVGGGYYNSAGGYAATVSGGDRNTASADDATVAGGLQNTASALYAAVGGGRSNVAVGRFSTVGGGYADTVRALYGGVLSGYSNLAGDAETDTGATVCGGYGNFAAEYFSAVGGGKNNYAGLISVVAGGRDNTANGASAVGGGVGNSAVGSYAAIAGGYGNDIDNGYGSFIGAGSGNSVPGAGHAVIGGGQNNEASGSHAALVGGNYNEASGDLSMVPGGAYNAARANYTLAAGRYARANHYGGFVWSDQSASASESLYTTNTNQFRVRARGGTWFYSNAAKTTGAYLAAGSNSWASACDSATKEDFREVDRRDLLGKVASLRVRDYKMRDQDDGTRHIGPVAQDFHAAFGVGENNTSINMADADGVLLAAVQALYEDNQQLRQELDALKAELKGK